MDLYQHANYKGKKNTVTKSGKVKLQNVLSSLKISSGCCATITGKTGTNVKYCKSSKFTGGWWKDDVASIKIERSELKFSLEII